MMHKIMSLLFISNLTILFLTTSNIQASLEPPHDSSNDISCENCHAVVPGILWGLLPREDDQEAMCKSCHNPTGQASGMYMVANHVVNEGARTIDCGSCHNQHNPDNTIDPHSDIPAPNLKLIRSDTKKYVPEALEPAIYQVNPDHFSFDTAPYNGICQTCHTNTNYHSNNGAGLSHQPGAICIDCHKHEDGFAHGGGGGSGCGSAAECHGLQDSHPTHVKLVADGGILEIDCADCHNTANFPEFADGNDLSSTTVCNDCHSPAGTNGVSDPEIGAIYNWDDGVYNVSRDSLLAGKDQWCISCHEDEPSVIFTVAAPDVSNFWTIGHGRNLSVQCLDCHNTASVHCDGEARTYSFDSAYYGPTQSGVAYADGYRLSYVSEEVPLMIPANYNITFSYDAQAMKDNAFRLCFSCHESLKILDDTPGDGISSNFKASLPNPPRDYSYAWGSGADTNEHVAHIMNYIGPYADSDWDIGTIGTGGSNGCDSLMACSSCHNVHGAVGVEGSSNEVMVRDGTLAGRTSVATGYGGYGFSYVIEDTGAGGYPWVTSTGANQTNSAGSIFRNNTEKANMMCGGSMCHGDPPAPSASSYDATGSSSGTYLEYFRPYQEY